MPAFRGCASFAKSSGRASTSSRSTVGTSRTGAWQLLRPILPCGHAASPASAEPATSRPRLQRCRLAIAHRPRWSPFSVPEPRSIHSGKDRAQAEGWVLGVGGSGSGQQSAWRSINGSMKFHRAPQQSAGRRVHVLEPPMEAQPKMSEVGKFLTQ